MKILYAAGEALPYIATGGLADVAGSLPRAINNDQDECRVVIPLYWDIPEKLRGSMKYLTSFSVPVAWRNQYCGVFEAENRGVKYYFIDNEYYFKRGGVYGHYDDAERYAFFSRAVLEMLRHIDFRPDVIHSNDWHTALIPVFYKVFYCADPLYENIRNIFTIHNIKYQGVYGKEIFEEILGLPRYSMPVLEYGNDLNFMKGAIVTSDHFTTVSPTYAAELRYPFYAYGLEHMINDNYFKFCGILNGIDTDSYDPETDPEIEAHFSAEAPDGKKKDKAALQQTLGLPQDPDALIVGMVTRLVDQKGVDLVEYVFEEMMTDHIQFVLLGKGDSSYESFFAGMQQKFPGKCSATVGFFQNLARRIYAGSDVLLMPSQTEPCGLAQMVALRYGTIPVVRETGGLNDSVTDCGSPEGNGYTFKTFNAHDMLGALRRAEGAFCNRDDWEKLVRRAMTCDFSWSRSAEQYRDLYQRVCNV